MQMKVVGYGSCQMWAIYTRYLKKEPMFENSTFHEYYCFLMAQKNEPLPIEDFQTADIFLYHPVSSHRGIYSTEDASGVLQYVSKKAILISIPFFYFDIYPIYEYGPQIRHGGALDKYKHMEFSEFANMYSSLELDFELKRRVNDSLTRLRKDEQLSNIKYTDFLEKNFRTHKLQNAINHPTAPLYQHIVNQIFEILGIEKRYNEFEYTDEIIHINPYPDSVYMAKELDISYALSNKDCLYDEGNLLVKWKG